METLTITCPGCKNVLVVNKKTGEIIEVRKPILEESTGDRFEDAFLKVKASAKAAEEKFKQAEEKRKERLKNLDQIFKESLEKAAQDKDSDEKPRSPFDAD